MTINRLLLAISLLINAQLALAAGKVDVKVEPFQQQQTVDAQGHSHTKLVPLNKVVPGTVVTYVIHYANNGKQAADQVVIHDPIPKQMRYIKDSAKGEHSQISYSVDDGKHWADQVSKLSIKGTNGEKRPATAADVTTLRWQVTSKVAPGAKGQVQFNAQLK